MALDTVIFPACAPAPTVLTVTSELSSAATIVAELTVAELAVPVMVPPEFELLLSAPVIVIS